MKKSHKSYVLLTMNSKMEKFSLGFLTWFQIKGWQNPQVAKYTNKKYQEIPKKNVLMIFLKVESKYHWKSDKRKVA